MRLINILLTKILEEASGIENKMDSNKYFITECFPLLSGDIFTTDYWFYTKDGAFKLCAGFQEDYPECSFSVVIN